MRRACKFVTGLRRGKHFLPLGIKAAFAFTMLSSSASLALVRQLAVDSGQAIQTGTNVAMHSFSTLRGLHQMRKKGHWECKVKISVIYENVLIVLYIA